jgi:hypothetical protein
MVGGLALSNPLLSTTLAEGVFTLHAAPADEALAQRVLAWAEEGRGTIEALLGMRLRTITIYLARPPDGHKARDFRGFVDQAYFDPRALRRAGENGRPIVMHELVHTAERQLLGATPGRVPKWFSEGLAIWISGERIEEEAIHRALACGMLPPLAEFYREWGPPEGPRARLGRAVAGSFWRFVAERCGRDTSRRILGAVKQGRTFAQAFATVTGESWEHTEVQWRVWEANGAD